MSDNLRMKSRTKHVYDGSCAYIVGNDGPSIIDNYVNALESLIMLSSLNTPRTYFVLTACSASVPSMNDNENSVSIMMKAQSKINKRSTLHSFHKKDNLGHDKHCKIIT